MKKQRIGARQLLVLMVLCCALMVGNFIMPSTVSEAATKKAAISVKELTIPVGKMSNKVYWNKNSWEISNGESLTVKNKLKGATYQFTSSNSKIVKINKAGGYVTGVKAGSATVTCTQTYKNKKTTVGKCKVTVKNATLISNERIFPVGSGGFNLVDYYNSSDPLFTIAFRNPKATYTITSDSSDFTIKEKKYDASSAKDATDYKEYETVLKDYIGKRYFYGYQFTANKSGTYTITVKETYNKKTKTLGSFKVEIKDASIDEPNVDILLGDYVNVFNFLSYIKDTLYNFQIKDYDEANSDNNVLQLIEEGDSLYLYGNKVGTGELTISEVDGDVIGTVTVTVAEAPCESITVYSEEYTAYVDETFNLDYYLEPWNTTDKVTMESDNANVVKVEYNLDEESWECTALKEGEANITIKCGNQSVVYKIIVEEW